MSSRPAAEQAGEETQNRQLAYAGSNPYLVAFLPDVQIGQLHHYEMMIAPVPYHLLPPSRIPVLLSALNQNRYEYRHEMSLLQKWVKDKRAEKYFLMNGNGDSGPCENSHEILVYLVDHYPD